MTTLFTEVTSKSGGGRITLPLRDVSENAVGVYGDGQGIVYTYSPTPEPFQARERRYMWIDCLLT